MLGSAIPRRWVFSLALVGLVTIFAVSYSAVWSSPANADSQGPGGGAGNSVVKTKAEILYSGELPTGLTIASGQQAGVTVVLKDEDGVVNAAFADLTFVWSVVSGGVSIAAGGTSPTVTLQGSSSGVVRVVVTQNQENRTWVVELDMSITVVSVAPTAVPSAAPTNPGTPPASIPNSQGVVTPEGAILVSSTGVESGSSPEGRSLNDRPVVYIRPGSTNNFYGIQVNSINPASLPPLPSNFNRGSSAVDITFQDLAGVSMESTRLLRSALICLPTNSSDRMNGFSNIVVLRYNMAVSQWVRLNTTYNTITQQACANSSNFSNFAVGVQQVQATPGSGGASLPATGGWSPTTSLLILIGLLGVALAGGGVITLRRARDASRFD